MGRRSSRRFHIIQKCLGAWRRATPPLGGFTLPSGNRASTDPAPLCLRRVKYGILPSTIRSTL
eukprot:4895514-Pyramimonas_sp.AAC.1